MKTNICTAIGICFFLLIGTTVQAQETKAKDTTTKAKPAASSTTKANVTTPAADAAVTPVNNTTATGNMSNKAVAPATAQPSNGKVNGEALAPQPTKKVHSATADPTAKELPNGNTPAPKNGKANAPAQNATTSPETASQKQVDSHKGHNHAEQSHQSHSHEAPNKTKEKTNNGNAYGKNKDGLKGKDFGQDRANQAKSKQKKKKKN
ncbi:MAG: hypothetical protein J5I47_13625 [Vicingus serpentipes]|nr:hypothetical protein [Vicingus serpentipes]